MSVSIRPGSQVVTAEGDDLGTIRHLVVDPSRSEVTHVLVEKGIFFTDDRPDNVAAAREAGYNAIRLGHLREGIELLRRFDPTRGILRGHDSYWLHLTFAHHQAGDYRQELRIL